MQQWVRCSGKPDCTNCLRALQGEIEKVRKRREEYAAMKVQMEEEKVIIDRERAIAEGRDAEAKEEEVGMPLMWRRGTSHCTGPLSYRRAACYDHAFGGTTQHSTVMPTVLTG